MNLTSSSAETHSAEPPLLLIGFIETEKRNCVIVPASVNVLCPMKPCYNDHVLQEDIYRQSKGGGS